MDYVEVVITEEMVKEAERKAEELGELKNSITGGKSNVFGFLGELVALKVIGGRLENTRDYDIVTDDGVKWDVKTKKTTVPPEDHFEVSVTNFNTKQKCDRYLFTRVLKDCSRGWVIGELPKQLYYDKATFIKCGQFDPRNNWRAKCDCWNVPFTELNEVKPSGSGAASAAGCCPTTPASAPSC